MSHLNEALPIECIEAKNILPESLRESPLVLAIVTEIYDGWPGQTGKSRVVGALEFIAKRLPQYATLMELPLDETLSQICALRTANYTNWFQDAHLPDLSNVLVFDNTESFLNRFPSKQYRCPSCGGITHDPSTCNSGIEMAKGKVCDWKVYGLFGGLGKEIRVVIKDQFVKSPRVLTIFPPIEID